MDDEEGGKESIDKALHGAEKQWRRVKEGEAHRPKSQRGQRKKIQGETNMAEMPKSNTDNSDIEADLRKLGVFLKDKSTREKIAEFVERSYLGYEEESSQRRIALEKHQHEAELQGALPHHKAGHIGGLLSQFLNMIAVENAFTSGLQHTKSSLTKTVQQRVDEINTLLRGVGGFNRQLKPSFSRSAVVYLEQEDPRRPGRERVIFTINLGEFELKNHLNGESKEVGADGRSEVRVGWDFAVNTLSEIVSNTGLKPTYVKNDKRSFHLSMRQDVDDNPEVTADEFFAFELDYNTQEKLNAKAEVYKVKHQVWLDRLADLEEQRDGWWTNLSKERRQVVQKELDRVERDHQFFLGSVPDPAEMDVGLQFTIRINTLKNYSITKDKMQVIMTKYILALSAIARDKSMDQQLMTEYGRPGGSAAKAAPAAKKPSAGNGQGMPKI